MELSPLKALSRPTVAFNLQALPPAAFPTSHPTSSGTLGSVSFRVSRNRSARQALKTPSCTFLRPSGRSVTAMAANVVKKGAELKVYEKSDELGHDLAAYVADLSAAAVSKTGVFSVVLSGGSLISSMGKLTEEPFIGKIDWSKWHVFWADERVVPLDHPDSNYKLALDGLLSKPQGTAQDLKFSVWGDRLRHPPCVKAPASFWQHGSCKLAIAATFSGDRQEQERVKRGKVSRRGWLLLNGFLAGLLSVPRHAHGLSRLSNLADNKVATDGSSLTNANQDMFGSTESRQQPAEDVKSWYRYRGEGFVIRVPPGYEDVLDYEEDEEGDDALYGKRAKDKLFAARFASPDRVEVLSIVIKPVSQLRLSFFETKDITDFGSIKEAAPNFVPPGAKLVSARIVNSKASRVPRTYYMYEFLVKGMHFMLSAGVSKGNVFVLGASTPQSKWKDYANRLQLAASTFYLP